MRNFDIANLLEVLAEVTDWYSLGIHLGLKPYQLNIIEKNYPGDNERQKSEMLSLCGSSVVNKFDWREIIVALTKMKKFRIARQIAYKKGNLKKNKLMCVFYCFIVSTMSPPSPSPQYWSSTEIFMCHKTRYWATPYIAFQWSSQWGYFGCSSIPLSSDRHYWFKFA